MRTRLTDFRDRVALVTGASSGIGARLAGDLVARGVRVALVARRAERLEQLAAELGPSRAMAIACDVSSRPAVEGAVARVLDHWGRLDLLVNNAGLARHGLFKDEDPDTFARVTNAALSLAAMIAQIRTGRYRPPDENLHEVRQK